MRVEDIKTRTKVLVGICVPLVLTVILGGVAITSIDSIATTGAQVDHTYKVLGQADSIVASAVDMETGMRGYLLAGQEGFLDPYTGGEKKTYASIAALQQTVNDNPGQVARLGEVEKVLREWQSNVTEPTIDLRRRIGDAKTMNDMASLVGEARGKKYFDKFRGQIQTFIDREAALLTTRRDDFAKAQEAVNSDFGLVNKTLGWVDHTNKVLATASSILANAVDMETGMRGFLLAGDDGFLEPYNNGKANLTTAIVALQETVNDNPAQVARLQEAEKTIADWNRLVTEPAIAKRKAVRRGIGTLGDIETMVNKKAGKKYFDAFRGLIADFSAAEAVLLIQRQADAATASAKVSGNLKIMKENEAWVTHTYKVIAQANGILANAVDMETGMRGYLLAGQEGFLDPYNGGQKQFFQAIAALRQTVSDNPAQVTLLTETESNISGWVKNVTEPTIQLRRDIGTAKTMDDMADEVGQAKGKQYFDKFRGLMAEFRAEEEGLMQIRQASSASTVSNTNLVISVFLGVAVVVGIALAFFIGNGIANPIIAMTKAMGKLADGDKTVEIPGTGRQDEVGVMANAVQVFKENMIEADQADKRQQADRQSREERTARIEALTGQFDKDAADMLGAVTTSASAMEATAGAMADIATATNEQANSVATASASATQNVQTVAASTEELSSSINEIGRQVEKSTKITRSAVEEVEKTNERIKELAESA
ncbi:MAG: methyl-accepting chemotaxis protein, partial [Cohaesibacteraceae bacterium]|nr:methyl-accepting chemotaxis protein [Cohaesibacteraceae bacterium]